MLTFFERSHLVVRRAIQDFYRAEGCLTDLADRKFHRGCNRIRRVQTILAGDADQRNSA